MMEGRLRERLGQPLVMDPRPGGGGMVGAEATARAAPDGYTFYVNHIASHGIGAALHKRAAFDPLRDLPGVARLAIVPNVLIVKGDGPVRDVAGARRLHPRESRRGRPSLRRGAAPPRTCRACCSGSGSARR